ncbi:MAG: hypothetical protein KDI92_02055 [Xanthomonadales bacterium]|nr:hypothetical protein [Xanthomonadales bacterium]
MNNSDNQKVLFFRNYRMFTGGHLKVWHYFTHLLNSKRFDPYVYFTADSIWDANNPFINVKNKVIKELNSINPDIYFLAGKDWEMPIKFDPQKPIINFIQHVRHANPKNPLYQYLSNKAIRICVSDEVKQALLASKQVNGPVFSIPNGFSIPKTLSSLVHADKHQSVLILALKNPAFGDELAERLRAKGIEVRLINSKLSQLDYLAAINNNAIAVFLPNPTEGFYLPAIEAMALQSLVICPDCIGNQSFCRDSETCIIPESYTLEAFIQSINLALNMDSSTKHKMLQTAARTSSEYTLEREREKFIDIMNQSDKLWQFN